MKRKDKERKKMKIILKKLNKIMIGTSVATLLAAASLTTVQAIDTSVVDEAWGKPTFVYGGGLEDAELTDTAELFEIEDMNNVASTPALGEDLVKYLGYGSGNTASMISSVLVQKDNNSGVNVDILTPENITTITAQQYTNAAITAGVEDVNIEVAAIRPVTGESALTGVYKALEVNGEDLDQERMEVAQEELETTSEIADEANLDEEQSGRLDGVIVDIKQQLADIKDRTDQLATREEIEQIINDALAKYDLQNVISVDNINILINYFENYQNTSAIDSEQVREQLNQFANDLGNKIGEVWQDAEESGLLDRIADFFREIVNSIIGLFN